MKLAFIHLMRTSGVFSISQIQKSGRRILDSWRKPYNLNRDWNKEESLIWANEIEEDCLFHNHVVNWDTDLLHQFKNRDWVTFSIFRNPKDQLCSLYNLQKMREGNLFDVSLNDYLVKQINGEKILDIDYKHWSIPDYWKEIDIKIPYEKNISQQLKNFLGIGFDFIDDRFNSTINKGYKNYIKSKEITEETNSLIENSSYYKRYLEVIGQERKSDKVIFLITSFKNNQKMREAIRKTWLKDLNSEYYFVIGDNKKPQRIEGDILYVNSGDSYEDCPMKQLLSIKYAEEQLEFDYLFCCDDDNYIIVDRLMDTHFGKYDYYGGGPVDMHGDPYYAQGGVGFFLSQKAAKHISDYSTTGEHLSCKWSDQMVGKILKDHGIRCVFNDKMEMGHGVPCTWISRDFNSIIASHKIKEEDIYEISTDVNPFHIFDAIYLINGNELNESQLDDLNISHLVTRIKGSYKDAVGMSFEKHKKILMIENKDVFEFSARNLFRNIIKDLNWEILVLGGESDRAYDFSEHCYKTNEIELFSGLALCESHFDSFIKAKNEKEWIKNKTVFYPKRSICTQGKDFKKPFEIQDKEIQYPIKVALIVSCFRRGGAEIEINEMITNIDKSKIQWVGISVEYSNFLDINPSFKDLYPPVYITNNNIEKAINTDGMILCNTFEESVIRATKDADVIIKWHVNNPLVELLPQKSIVISNTFGRWPLHIYKNIKSDIYVGNSNHSCKLFWNDVTARTIYSGHSLDRLETSHDSLIQKEKWGFDNSDKIVGYTGRIDPNKNIKTLIKSMSYLSKEWKLVLVGQKSNDTFEEIQILLDKHIPNRYFVDEWCYSVGDALTALDCFVLVSDYEGFSNSLAEAWMLKIPTVFSRCGSVIELENKYGKIGVSTNIGVDPKNLSEKIKESVSDNNKVFVEKIASIIKDNTTMEKSIEKWQDAIEDAYKKIDKIKVSVVFKDINKDIKNWFEQLSIYSKEIELKFVQETDAKREKFDFAASESYVNVNQLNYILKDTDVVFLLESDVNFLDNLQKPIIFMSQNGEYLTNIKYCNDFCAIDEKHKKMYPDMLKKSVILIESGFDPDLVYSDLNKLKEDKVLIGYYASEESSLIINELMNKLPSKFESIKICEPMNEIDLLLVSNPDSISDEIIMNAWANNIIVASKFEGVFERMSILLDYMPGLVYDEREIHNFSERIKNFDHLEYAFKDIKEDIIMKTNPYKVFSKWSNYIKSVIKKNELISLEYNLKRKIKYMLDKGMSEKKIAVNFNKEQIPTPNGEHEWTYLLVSSIQ